LTPLRQFAFRLALASGYWVANPDAMLAAMPFRVLMQWVEYDQLDPIGNQRADLQAGIVASTVANSILAVLNSFSKRKTRRTFTPGDFMPEFKGRIATEEMTKRHHQKAVTLTQAFGGNVVYKKAGEV
jgi:hypothetical protein